MDTRKPKVMLLGTFHFEGSSDIVQIKSGQLTSDKKQQEIADVVEKITKFKPTKVAVEIKKKYNDKLNKNYLDFLNDSFTLTLNEVHQLGFRISRNQQLKAIYAIDWMENVDNRGIGDVFDWAKENQPSLFNAIMNQYINQLEPEISDLSISEALKLFNQDKQSKKEQEAYMQIARIGIDDEYIGIDWLRWWYQRNLIIYKNIIDLIESEDERILLIIGAGHRYLINQFLTESGTVDIIDPNQYL